MSFKKGYIPYQTGGGAEGVFYSSSYATLQQAINAAAHGCLVIDRDYTENVSLTNTANSGMRIWGKGEGVTTITAATHDPVLACRASNVTISDLKLDGGGVAHQGLAVGDVCGAGTNSSVQCTFQNMEIQDCDGAALEFQDQWYYIQVSNVRMMDGNIGGIHFNTAAGAAGDNGQTGIYDCEISGTEYDVKRTVVAATAHRILLARCGFYDCHLGAYQVDLSGLHNTTLLNCDFELSASGAPSASLLKFGGYGQTAIGCLWSCRNEAGFDVVVGDGAYDPYPIVGGTMQDVAATSNCFTGSCLYPGATSMGQFNMAGTLIEAGSTGTWP